MIDPIVLGQVAAHPLVHVNAALNGLATVLLIAGFVLIKQGKPDAHARVMLATFVVSSVFLVCYLVYHYQVGSVKFTHPGIVRYLYLVILLTHVVLAAAVPFLAVATIYFGLVGQGWFRAEKTPHEDRSGLPEPTSKGWHGGRFPSGCMSRSPAWWFT